MKIIIIILFLFGLTACVSPETVRNIEQNTSKLVVINKGQLDILTEVNKTNKNVIEINKKVDEALAGIKKGSEGIIPDGGSLLVSLVLILLGLKNGGQIFNYFKVAALQFIGRRKNKKNA